MVMVVMVVRVGRYVRAYTGHAFVLCVCVSILCAIVCACESINAKRKHKHTVYACVHMTSIYT